MRRRASLALVALLGCTRPPAPAPPVGVATVAVLPPANRTGDELVVTGSWLLERWLTGGRRVTVPEVLANDARERLTARGFHVVAPAEVERATGGRAPANAGEAAEAARRLGIDGAALFIEIRRWQPDYPALDYIIVALDATLVDAASGRVVWQASRPAHTVPTLGAPTGGAASETAARAEVRALLDDWKPAAVAR